MILRILSVCIGVAGMLAVLTSHTQDPAWVVYSPHLAIGGCILVYIAGWL